MQINNLAHAVIKQALDDYLKAGIALRKKSSSWIQRTHANSTLQECEDFLRGKTKIAKHWFTAADLPFFNTALLKSAAVSGVARIEKRAANSANSYKRRLAKRAHLAVV